MTTALLLAATLLAAAPAAPPAPAKTRVLIVTGVDTAHNWKLTGPATRDVLEQDPRLEARVVEDPEFLASPTLADYDVVLLEFMNPEPLRHAAAIHENLTRLVKGGKGLVVLHFSCGAMSEWPEFLDLAGKVWDRKTTHDPRGPFTVKITNANHPITRGMHDFQADDELYYCLTGDRPVDVLAVAHSKVKDADQPMALVHAFGKGRVFQTPLGHDAKAQQMPGVANLLRRGCLWAAGRDAELSQDEIDRQVAELKAQHFPLVDLHIHLKGGLTVEEALAQARRNGFYYGIAANCGLKFPITDDRGIDEYVTKMKGQPCYVGMQAEGREWPTLFSKASLAKFDYVFTDAMTIVDHRGQRARLWMPDEVDIPDKQAFMELLVRTIENILGHEPINIYANPTYLPDVIAKDYDELWTPARQQRVIAAAAKHHIAIEISNRLRLPKPAFIKAAKQAGIKFTFGTNNVDTKLGREEYALEMIKECGLTASDMWLPAKKAK